jgi:TRAP transporter TAXI family solute receptor
MKNTLTKLFAVLFIFSLLFTTTNNSFAQEKRAYVIATASPGGTYYPVGVAIATLVTDKLGKDGISMSAITSAGSGENVQLLKNHEVDFAILQGLFGSMAWQGKGKYEGKPEKEMRAVTMLWENVEHFVVYKEFAPTNNIMDLNNLKGEKFSIGKRGSGTETSGKTILTALGFNPEKDFRLEHMGYSASATALQDRRVLGMNIPAGPPVSAITQAFATIGADKITVLEFTDDQLKQIDSHFPVWSRYVIPAETYPGQTKPINTIAQPNFLAVRPDISDEDVYKILETIYSNLDFLHNMHKATYAMKLERAINGLPVPLHPGAVKFYKDKGFKIPDNLIMK